MHIGIDLACWTNHRGYGRYTRNLLRAVLAAESLHRFSAFADASTLAAGGFPAGMGLVPVALSESPTTAASAHGRRKVADMWRLSRAVQRSGVDLMFFPSTYTFFPVLGRTRCVVVVHDAIAERFPHLIFPTLAGRAAWTVKSRIACWQADRVVTVSQDAAAAVRRHLRVQERRLRVVYEAADPMFAPGAGGGEAVRVRYALPGRPLLLYVGGFAPHKNLGALLTAFASLLARQTPGQPRPHLTLVGKTEGDAFHSCYAELRALIAALGIGGDVTFTGYVPDADLLLLYRTATCLVLPSRDEGFGLPVVEAMACGTPVVTSRGGALPELVADAGLLVDPDHTEEFAAALRTLLDTPVLRAELRQRGLRRSEQLSWDRAAVDVLHLFDELDPGRHRLAPPPSKGRNVYA
jgi:glycosyltransferase involved in cell wall biosynthesis